MTGENSVATTPQFEAALSGVTSVSLAESLECGSAHALAITADGSAWAWGDNAYLETRPSGSSAVASPVLTGGGLKASVSRVLAGPDESLVIGG
jgi:alpha-tubulin suppressor-like RCC1 family protein